MSDAVFPLRPAHTNSFFVRLQQPAVENVPNRIPTEAAMARVPRTPAATAAAPTFPSIVTILVAVMVVLLGVITGGGGFYLSGLRTDMGEVRKDVGDIRKDISDVRVEAAKTNTKLDDLNGEIRRRFPR